MQSIFIRSGSHFLQSTTYMLIVIWRSTNTLENVTVNRTPHNDTLIDSFIERYTHIIKPLSSEVLRRYFDPLASASWRCGLLVTQGYTKHWGNLWAAPRGERGSCWYGLWAWGTGPIAACSFRRRTNPRVRWGSWRDSGSHLQRVPRSGVNSIEYPPSYFTVSKVYSMFRAFVVSHLLQCLHILNRGVALLQHQFRGFGSFLWRILPTPKL